MGVIPKGAITFYPVQPRQTQSNMMLRNRGRGDVINVLAAKTRSSFVGAAFSLLLSHENEFLNYFFLIKIKYE